MTYTRLSSGCATWSAWTSRHPTALGLLLRSMSTVSVPKIPSSSSPCKLATSTDGKTIVCIHREREASVLAGKPLKPVIQETEECRLKLGHEEVKQVRKLRKEDGSLWTVNTLAKYFSTLPSVIRRVSSADPKRQKELDEEKASLAKMRPHKRKMYKLEKQLMRAARLKELLQQRAPLAAKDT
ncbi:hypothetical protein EMCRGX_G028242 [Ephydatia muelleri]|eukprot:Em0020g423a